MAAGGITGLLAGIGVVIAVAKEIDLGSWEGPRLSCSV
jgi:hypothetical protein